MNRNKIIIKCIIYPIFFIIFIIGIKNTFLGKYSIINHIKIKKQIEYLKNKKANKQQIKTKLIYQTKQLKNQQNLITFSTKKINIIKKNYFIIY